MGPLRRAFVALLFLWAVGPGEAHATYAPKCGGGALPGELRRLTAGVADEQPGAGGSGRPGRNPVRHAPLDQLLARPAGSHSSLWFSHCPVLSDGKLAALADRLTDHLDGGRLGPARRPARHLPAGRRRRPDASAARATRGHLAGRGPRLGRRGRLARSHRRAARTRCRGCRAGRRAPPSPRGWPRGRTCWARRRLAAGRAHAAADLRAATTRHPYAVITRPGSGRVLAISGYGHDAGAATPVPQRFAARVLRQPAAASPGRRRLLAARRAASPPSGCSSRTRP